MSVRVELPQLGESVVEGTVARWLVKEGDRVEEDQPLVEVTTDKVDAEIPAPVTGVIERIVAGEGAVVPVGGELALIRPAEGVVAGKPAKPSIDRTGKPAQPARSEAQPSVDRTGLAKPARSEAQPSEDRTAVAGRATPVARRMAADAEVELSGVPGSGASGRVTKRDVARAVAGKTAAPAPPARQPAPAQAGRAKEAARPAFLQYTLQPGDRVIPMSPLRRLVAEHMVLSKQTSPHVGTVTEIDMAGVVRVRDAHKRAFQENHGFPLTFLPFVVHAAVRALREYPILNASVLEDAIVEKKDVHVGIAVETEKGLVVPVVRHADRLSLAGLAAAVEDLSNRARSKRLSADELKGGTFTISNPGRYGNLYGFAIINQPQVGILRMGEIVKRPVVRTADGEDAIAIRPIMHLALSYDHRAVDGAPANGFLHRIRELLEEAEFDL